MRFFTEFTLSLKIRPFVSLRVTGGEGFRMTDEEFRVTSMAFPSLRHTPSGERGRVRGHKMLEEYYQNLTCKNLISFQDKV